MHTGNVLLCHFGDKFTAKVADFDMAKFIDFDRKGSQATRFKDEDYLPPEMFPHTDHKTANVALLTCKVDVFCFGGLALEVARGSYLGLAVSKRKKGDEILSEVQRRESHLISLTQSEKELGQTIRRCLADEPEGRPTFTDILQDIHKYLGQPDAVERATPVSYIF